MPNLNKGSFVQTTLTLKLPSSQCICCCIICIGSTDTCCTAKEFFFLPRSECSLLHNTASFSCTILSQATKIACTAGKRQFNEKHRYVLHIKEKQTCIGKSFTNICYHCYQCNASFCKLNHR